MTDQRIKLAEFVGWKRHEADGGVVGIYDYWESPEGETHGMTTFQGPKFNPRNDANDCEALIRKLNEAGHDVVVHHNNEDRQWVWFHTPDNRITWKGDDWKQGVCDLAEKIIDQAT